MSPDDLLDGRYRLEQLIGAGGATLVYRAVDERLGRVVAVKLLKPELARDPAYLVRFRQAAVRAAQINHPNIATILDVSTDPAHPYIVMRFIDGEPLKRLAPLPIAEAVELACQAAGALAFLHDRQLVHGDVKPANLLVDQDGLLKLVDLGVAPPPGPQAGPTIPGSPAYLAPERLQGAPVSPATDVYGLGVTLFEALTGRPPFAGDTIEDTLAQVRANQPPPLSRLRPDAPPALQHIIARAMSRDPADRLPDMAAFAQALEELQMRTGQVTLALPCAAMPLPDHLATAQPAALPVSVPARRQVPRLPWLAMLGLLLLSWGIVGLTLIRRGLQAMNSTPPAASVPVTVPTGVSTPTQKTIPAVAIASPTATRPRPTATRIPIATRVPPTATPVPTATIVPPTRTPILPSPTSPAPLVEVPNVIGMQEKDARKAIEAVGLHVGRIIRLRVPGARKDVVWRQLPLPGQRVATGTAVHLLIAAKNGGD